MREIKKIVLAICLVFCVFGCSKNGGKSNGKSVAVFVPGVVSGNPVYEMLVSGVSKACSEAGESAELTVIEAGTNQAEWAGKLTALASSGKYDAIISSNPSLPALVEPLTEQFPSVKWLLLDGYLEGNPNVVTLRYNQKEQGYIAGFVAGLVTTSDMDYANPAKKIALIAAQEYPVMNEVILPAFAEGAAAVDPSCWKLGRCRKGFGTCKSFIQRWCRRNSSNLWGWFSRCNRCCKGFRILYHLV